MEKIIIKIKSGRKAKYNSNRAIKNLMHYITREKGTSDKVRHWGTRGLNHDIDKASAQFIKTQKLLRKNKNRRAYHIIVSFPIEFQDIDFVNTAADKVADYFGYDYQVVYGVHTNTKVLHFHLMINSVSYVTGLKFHKNKHELEKMKGDILTVINSIS
ncbi:MAG: relaxase/mobilization nuclease domain-containing protein [Lachnospiraceae bacterium]|nr:relaxase/mobilization nuclease domain-containing protein [Lachnospiraceae bacterium]